MVKYAFIIFLFCQAIAAQDASQNPEWIRLVPSFLLIYMDAQTQVYTSLANG